MNQTKQKICVERDGFWTEASLLLMGLAVVFRLLGSIGHWDNMTVLATQVALPIFSGLLFIACVLLFGHKAFWTSSIPALFGVVFFIFRVMEAESDLQKLLGILLYVVVVVLYVGTAFSRIRFKWLLALLFGLAFLYHVAVEDLPVLLNTENPVSFVDGMQEMSILAILLSLMSISLAMKLPEPELAELPKIKDPVVIVPEQEPEAAAEPACVFPEEEIQLPVTALEPSAEGETDAP